MKKPIPNTPYIYQAIPPGLKYVSCKCGEITCARTPQAITLKHWTRVDLEAGKGECPRCNGSWAQVKLDNAPAPGYWVFQTFEAADGLMMPSPRPPFRAFTPEAYRGTHVRIYPAVSRETTADALAALIRFDADAMGWQWTNARPNVTRWVPRPKDVRKVEQAESLFGADDMQALEAA